MDRETVRALSQGERVMSEQSPAAHALLDYSQADMDGIIVTTSRQAIHEVLAELATLRIRAEAAEAERDAMRAVVEAAREWAKPGPTNDQLQAREDALREALATKEG